MTAGKWLPIRAGALVSPKRDALVLIVKPETAARLAAAFPAHGFKAAPYKGNMLVALPYELDTVSILRNLGINTQGIEVLRYKAPLPLVEQVFPLMPHQITTSAFFTENERAFCTSTMRTGKTASAIIAARFLQQQRKMNGCLIISTLSTLESVWEKEIRGLYPQATIEFLHHRDMSKRAERLSRYADFYILNFDGIKYLRDALIECVDSGQINGCIVDELTHFAQTTSQLWDAADQVINGVRWRRKDGKTVKDKYGNLKVEKGKRLRTQQGAAIRWVWGLTGTPGDPEMVYGQVKIVNPPRMSMSFTTWRDRTMVKFGGGFKWFPREGYKEQIYQVMQPCIRFDKADVMKLAPVYKRSEAAQLEDEQATLYRQLRHDMLVQADGQELKATTKASLTFKLLQLAQGVVKTEDGELAVNCKARLDHLEGLVREAKHKVVIFAAFTAVIKMLVAELGARGFSVAMVDGSVSGRKRSATFHKFVYEKDPHIIICHPKTTAFGVELAAADTMIFYGPPISGEFVFQQAVERLSSAKQVADTIHIIEQYACPEEKKLFESIQRGVRVNEAINDMFTRQNL